MVRTPRMTQILAGTALAACGIAAAPDAARAEPTIWLACHIQQSDGSHFDPVFTYSRAENTAAQFKDGYLFKMLNVSIDPTSLHMIGWWSPPRGKYLNLFEIDRRNLGISYSAEFAGGRDSGLGSCEEIPAPVVYPDQF